MPLSRDTDTDGDGGEGPRMTLWQRLKYAMVRPDDEPAQAKEAQEERSVEEIREEIRRSNDKERAIGFAAAPIAAVVGLVISQSLVSHASTPHDRNVYIGLTWVLMGLAVLILLASWLRKRLFQGVTLALFGVAIFQLHYTYVGFAVPFILAAAWYLVRSYRLQQELRRAEEGSGPPSPKGGSRANGSRPRSNKRYTPPR